MARWLAAVVLGLFLLGRGTAAFAGDEGGDPPAPGHHGGGHVGQTDPDSNGDLHSGHQ